MAVHVRVLGVCLSSVPGQRGMCELSGECAEYGATFWQQTDWPGIECKRCMT